MKIELELMQIKFISGNIETLWVGKGIENIMDRIKFIEAFGIDYDDSMNEVGVNASRKYTIRMESIEYIEYKDKFNSIEFKDEE